MLPSNFRIFLNRMQIYFLNSRFRQILDIRKGDASVIQDRSIYEDAQIFAPNLHDMGLMSTRDYQNYINLYKTIQELIEPPDLLIYLRASIPALVNQIEKRGRDYEDNIRLDYLKKLNQRYEDWINAYSGKRLLIVDVENCNFADKREHLGDLIRKIESERSGLF